MEKSLPVEIQVFPYEQASALLDGAKSIGVRKCICKVQKGLIGQPCTRPVEVCLIFASVEGAFANDPLTRSITKAEARTILREAEETGLIHSSTNVREGHMILCNCCTCCCGMLRGISQLGIANSIAKSDFYVTVDPDRCSGSAICVERCEFNALAMRDNIAHVDLTRCVGCGQCVVACPSEAVALVRKPDEQRASTPKTIQEWMLARAQDRGISIQEVI